MGINDVNNSVKIFGNRFFELRGVPRKAPNEFTELAGAIDNFKDEFKKLVCPYIKRVLEWLIT